MRRTSTAGRCPNIPWTPKDIGRTYDADVIRINSQSGKGGIGYLLEQTYGYILPGKMREHLGYTVKSVSDHATQGAFRPEVRDVFQKTYLNKTSPFKLVDVSFIQKKDFFAVVTLETGGQQREFSGTGNGRLDAVANAIQSGTGMEFTIDTYTQHALEQGSTSRAISYVGLKWGSGTITWGAGTDTDVMTSSVKAPHQRRKQQVNDETAQIQTKGEIFPWE